jgi:hypothetical protein
MQRGFGRGVVVVGHPEEVCGDGIETCPQAVLRLPLFAATMCRISGTEAIMVQHLI